MNNLPNDLQNIIYQYMHNIDGVCNEIKEDVIYFTTAEFSTVYMKKKEGKRMIKMYYNLDKYNIIN